MEIRIRVPDAMVSEAQARGMSVEVYVENLLAHQTAENSAGVRRLQTPEDIRTWLDSLAQFSDKIPPLPHTISRDWIYLDHD
jgi:hypothetical protein